MIFRGSADIPETRLTMGVAKRLTALPASAEGVPGKPHPFGVFHRTAADRVLVPRYFYIQHLRKENDKITVHEPKQRKEDIKWVGTLYPEQQEGLGKMVAALLKYHGVIGQGRCGVGKTVLGTRVIAEIRAATTLVLVDRTNLAEQWAAAVHERLPDLSIGFVMPDDVAGRIRRQCGLPDPTGPADVTIALVQSVMSRDEEHKATLLIVDEVHKFSAPCFSQAMFKMSFRYSLGLTATVARRDGLSWVFGAMLGTRIVQLSGRRLTPTAYSVAVPTSSRYPVRRFQMLYCRHWRKSVIAEDCNGCPVNPGHGPCDNSGGLSKNVNFTRLMIELSKDETRNNGINELVLTLANAGHDVLVMGKFKNHLIHLRELFAAKSDRPTSLYFGGMNRDALNEQVTYATFGMGEHGLDAPWKSAIVLALPLSDPEQSVGRVERVCEGKKAPVIIDPYVSGDFLGAQWTRRKRFYEGAGYAQRTGTLAEVCAWLAVADT